MKNIDNNNLNIRANNNSKRTGLIDFAHQSIPCIFGRGGIASRKKEGDGATPKGEFKILYGFYRADRIRHLSTNIQMIPIKENYGWCDDTNSPLYNRFIRLPSNWRHENLWREDHLYDICLVLDFNLHPRKRNGGSAIFFHLKQPDNKPTEGCIAVSLEYMRKLLRLCDSQSNIIIHL